MNQPLRPGTKIVEADGSAADLFARLWQSVLSAQGPVIRPLSVQDPGTPGDLVIEATNDTTLTFKYRGSDNVVRTATVTLT